MEILDTVFVYRLSKDKNLIWHGRYHAHDENEFEVHFFLDGEGSFLSNSTRIAIGKNTLFLSGPHEFHSIVPSVPARPLTYYAVLFKLDAEKDFELYHLLMGLIRAQKHAVTRVATDANRFLFEELLRYSSSKAAGLVRASEYMVMSLLYRWFAGGSELATAAVLEEEKSMHHEAVQNALAYFASNLGKPITIYNAAYKLGLSAEHFIRVFRQEMHMTPYQYLLRLRIEAAAGELVASDKAISTISEHYAFENQFHFSRVFKKCTGLTPSAYRACYKQNALPH